MKLSNQRGSFFYHSSTSSVYLYKSYDLTSSQDYKLDNKTYMFLFAIVPDISLTSPLRTWRGYKNLSNNFTLKFLVDWIANSNIGALRNRFCCKSGWAKRCTLLIYLSRATYEHFVHFRYANLGQKIHLPRRAYPY